MAARALGVRALAVAAGTAASPSPADAGSAQSFVAPASPTGLAALAPTSAARSDDWDRLVTRGEFHLAAGNIAIARQFFLRAAEAGSAQGALLLAATCDPRELAGPKILGIQPNSALALSWYRRAQELGCRLGCRATCAPDGRHIICGFRC